VIIAGKVQARDVFQSLQEHQRTLSHLRLYGGWIADETFSCILTAVTLLSSPIRKSQRPVWYPSRMPSPVRDHVGHRRMKDVVSADTGILVPPKDAKALRTAIEGIFTRDLRFMGERARAFADKEFELGSECEETQGILCLAVIYSTPVIIKRRAKGA